MTNPLTSIVGGFLNVYYLNLHNMEIFYNQGQTISITKMFNGVLENGHAFNVIGVFDSHQWYAESVLFDVSEDRTDKLESKIIEKFEEDMNS